MLYAFLYAVDVGIQASTTWKAIREELSLLLDKRMHVVVLVLTLLELRSALTTSFVSQAALVFYHLPLLEVYLIVVPGCAQLIYLIRKVEKTVMAQLSNRCGASSPHEPRAFLRLVTKVLVKLLLRKRV